MNRSAKFVSQYFDPPPSQWGYRGNPHLWDAMRENTSETIIPSTSAGFISLLHKLFSELTGERLLPTRSLYVGKYDTGGMSKGMINCDFWLEKAFPLLISRYEADHTL